MSSAYARPPVRLYTLRGRNLSRVGKGVANMYVSFRFWSKINHFRGNQFHQFKSKNLDRNSFPSTYDRIIGNIFLKLCVLPGHAFLVTPQEQLRQLIIGNNQNLGTIVGNRAGARGYLHSLSPVELECASCVASICL